MAMNLWNHKPYRALSDEELMQRVCSHDSERAFNELYRRHARRLQGFFFRMLWGNETQAADFTQETFLRLWESRTRYQKGRAVRPWLFTIAYNLCRNEYRMRDTVPEQLELTESKGETYEPLEELRMDAADFDRALETELQKLPSAQRLLFALRYEEELTVPQVAEVLGIPEGTAKSRLHHLLQLLRTKLKAYEHI